MLIQLKVFLDIKTSYHLYVQKITQQMQQAVYSPTLIRGKCPAFLVNSLTPNDLQRRRAVSPLKIKIPSKKSRQAALRGGI
jgi:hypothetical protein